MEVRGGSKPPAVLVTGPCPCWSGLPTAVGAPFREGFKSEPDSAHEVPSSKKMGRRFVWFSDIVAIRVPRVLEMHSRPKSTGGCRVRESLSCDLVHWLEPCDPLTRMQLVSAPRGKAGGTSKAAP
jgi:hypothetical protein